MTVSLFGAVKTAMGKEKGCEGCTMLSPWRTVSSQKPSFCRLDKQFIFCPITGELPREWERFYNKSRYLFVDDDFITNVKVDGDVTEVSVK